MPFSINPALPTSLMISASSGAIMGTPAAASAATTYTITATNTFGQVTATADVTVHGPAAPTIASFFASNCFLTSSFFWPIGMGKAPSSNQQPLR